MPKVLSVKFQLRNRLQPYYNMSTVEQRLLAVEQALQGAMDTIKKQDNKLRDANADIKHTNDQLADTQAALHDAERKVKRSEDEISLAAAQFDQMKNKMTALANAPTTTTGGGGGKQPPKITFANLETDDWRIFRRNFVDSIECTGHNDYQAKRALSSCMRGAAALAVEGVDYRNTAYALEAILDEYETIFLPAASSAMAQTRYETCQQLPRETILGYHGRLKALWMRAYPHMTDESQLIRKFYNSIRGGKELRGQIMRARPATYQAVLAAAQNECAVQDTLKGTQPGYNMHPKADDSEPMDLSALSLNAIAEEDADCFKCKRKGHFKRNCPEEQSHGRRAATMSRGVNRDKKDYRKDKTNEKKGDDKAKFRWRMYRKKMDAAQEATKEANRLAKQALAAMNDFDDEDETEESNDSGETDDSEAEEDEAAKASGF